MCALLRGSLRDTRERPGGGGLRAVVGGQGGRERIQHGLVNWVHSITSDYAWYIQVRISILRKNRLMYSTEKEKNERKWGVTNT